MIYPKDISLRDVVWGSEEFVELVKQAEEWREYQEEQLAMENFPVDV